MTKVTVGDVTIGGIRSQLAEIDRLSATYDPPQRGRRKPIKHHHQFSQIRQTLEALLHNKEVPFEAPQLSLQIKDVEEIISVGVDLGWVSNGRRATHKMKKSQSAAHHALWLGILAALKKSLQYKRHGWFAE